MEGRRRLQRGLFSMKCKSCGHVYQYEGEKYEVENCPLCGHQDKFNSFVEERKNGDRDAKTK